MTCYISKPGDGGNPRFPGWGLGCPTLAWLQNGILRQAGTGSSGWKCWPGRESWPHTQAWSRGPGANSKGKGDRQGHGEYTEIEGQGGWERAGRGNARRDKKKKKGKTFKREKDGETPGGETRLGLLERKMPKKFRHVNSFFRAGSVLLRMLALVTIFLHSHEIPLFTHRNSKN